MPDNKDNHNNQNKSTSELARVAESLRRGNVRQREDDRTTLEMTDPTEQGPDELGELLVQEQEVLSRRAATLEPGAKPATPKTIRIKRPESEAPTRVLRKPGVVEAAAVPAAGEPRKETQKTETARIELPPGAAEAPPTRRKTIRIRRPEGAPGGLPLRPVTVTAPTMPVAVAAEDQGARVKADEPGTVVAVLGLVAAMVAVVLLYVLAAQTLAPTLPFPGRIP